MIFIIHPDRSVTSVIEHINVGETATDVIVISPFLDVQNCSMRYTMPNGAYGDPKFLDFKGTGTSLGTGFEGMIYSMPMPADLSKIPGTIHAHFILTNEFAREFVTNRVSFTVDGFPDLPFPSTEEQGADFAQQLKAMQATVQRLISEDVENVLDRVSETMGAFDAATAEANTVDSNQKASALLTVYDDEDGVKRVRFTFDIPEGKQGPKGKDGEKGESGEPFRIAKNYPSVTEMNADHSGSDVLVGQYVTIASDVNDDDNAKIYRKDSDRYRFVTDMSGAAGIEGPRGPQGVEGPQGLPGPKGDPGPCYVLTEQDKQYIAEMVRSMMQGDSNEWYCHCGSANPIGERCGGCGCSQEDSGSDVPPCIADDDWICHCGSPNPIGQLCECGCSQEDSESGNYVCGSSSVPHYYYDDADERWYEASEDFVYNTTGNCPNCGCRLSEYSMSSAFNTECPSCSVPIRYHGGTVTLGGGNDVSGDEKTYLIKDVVLQPFNDDTINLFEDDVVVPHEVGLVLHAVVDGEEYATYTLDYGDVDNMQMGFWSVCFDYLVYGCDVQATGINGWYWMGSEPVTVSVYY